jgi:hypothetical protein
MPYDRARPDRCELQRDRLRPALFSNLKHRLQYVERWVGPDKGGARGLGTDWHKVLEALFRMLMEIQREMQAAGHGPAGPFGRWEYGPDVADRVMEAIRATDVLAGLNAELVNWMLEGYLRKWGLRSNWTVLAVEFNPQSSLPGPDGQPSLFDLKCKLDLVVQDTLTGWIWIVDHKSGQRRPQVAALNLDDQFGLYTWILRRLGRPVYGAIHSWSKTSKPKTFVDKLEDRFEDFPMDRSETELDTIASDAFRSIDAAYKVDGEPLVYPDGEWCRRRCDFVNAHLAARRGFAPIRSYLRDTGYEVDFTRH